MTQVIWDKRGQNHSKVINANELSQILEHVAREGAVRAQDNGQHRTYIFTSLTPDITNLT